MSIAIASPTFRVLMSTLSGEIPESEGAIVQVHEAGFTRVRLTRGNGYTEQWDGSFSVDPFLGTVSGTINSYTLSFGGAVVLTITNANAPVDQGQITPRVAFFAGEDRLEGSNLDDQMLGFDGNDVLLGKGGSDILFGGSGVDFVFGGGFNPDGSFEVNSGADTLEGGDGNDGLWGQDGNDLLRGGAGSDGIVGGAGNDSLEGGDDADFLFGGDFSPVDGSLLPNSGDDTLAGGNGNDGLWGFDGNDLISGEVGDDYVEGGAGNDAILGGTGNDSLLGQAGGDALAGGAGYDYLYGGAGADLFLFNRGDSVDTVLDFNAAEGDRIRLDPAFGIATQADLQSHLSGYAFDGVDYTVIDFPDSADKLIVKGIAHTDFTLSILAA